MLKILGMPGQEAVRHYHGLAMHAGKCMHRLSIPRVQHVIINRCELLHMDNRLGLWRSKMKGGTSLGVDVSQLVDLRPLNHAVHEAHRCHTQSEIAELGS